MTITIDCVKFAWYLVWAQREWRTCMISSVQEGAIWEPFSLKKPQGRTSDPFTLDEVVFLEILSRHDC
jgi:hypothetical protein